MFIKTAGILFITLFVTACSSAPKRSAPIVDISPSASVQSAANGSPSGIYVVKPGENLYRIAFEHGLTYRDLAAWNNIVDVNDIKVGQVLKLSGPEGAGTIATGVVVTGTNRVSNVHTKPLDSRGTATSIAGIKNGTLTAKTPITAAPTTAPVNFTALDEDTIKMSWPALGPVAASFAKNGKGIDISGKVGQAVAAAADGSVVYSGAGLRGYGKMIILKHNKTYLTAYAHNNKLLVKEGDSVKKGQKIAEMGNTDADSVKLHFEVRRFGKPVDPTKYLTN